MRRKPRRPLALIVLLSACGAPQPGPPAAPATASAATEKLGPAASTAPSAAVAPSSSTAEPAHPNAPAPSLPELQKKALRGMVLAFNAHDAKGLAALYSPNAIVRSPSHDGYVEEQGRDAIEQGHAALFAKTPDIKIGTVRVLQKADVIVWEYVVTAPNALGFNAASVLWFDSAGLIKVDHTYFDRTTIAGQLGELPKGEKFRAVVEAPKDEGPWLQPKDEGAEAKVIDVARALFAAYEAKDEKGFLAKIDDKTLRDDLTDPTPPVGGVGTNSKEFKALVKAFPDARATVDSAVAVGVFVAVETTMTGTHKGAFGPFKATNRKVTLRRLDVLEIPSHGKVIAWTSYGNRRELTAQIAPATPPKKPSN